MFMNIDIIAAINNHCQITWLAIAQWFWCVSAMGFGLCRVNTMNCNCANKQSLLVASTDFQR